MEANLKAVIQLLVKKRWPFRLHATYNESISRDLAVIEEVNKETPLNGLVWLIDHAETISEENLQRIKALGEGLLSSTGWLTREKVLYTGMEKRLHYQPPGQKNA